MNGLLVVLMLAGMIEEGNQGGKMIKICHVGPAEVKKLVVMGKDGKCPAGSRVLEGGRACEEEGEQEQSVRKGVGERDRTVCKEYPMPKGYPEHKETK